MALYLRSCGEENVRVDVNGTRHRKSKLWETLFQDWLDKHTDLGDYETCSVEELLDALDWVDERTNL